MSINLVDLVQSQMGSQLVGQMSGLLGSDDATTQKAVNGAVPALLGSLMNTASSDGGPAKLMGAMEEVDTGLLSNLSGMLGGNENKGVMDMGTKLLGNVMGSGGLSSMIGAIAGFSGMKKAGAGSLMGLLAPIVMGTIKRQLVGGSGLNPANLSSLLMGQKDNIASAMPAGLDKHLESSGLGSMLGGLGLGGLGNAAGNVAQSAQNVGSSVTNAAGNAANAAGNAASAAGTAAGNAAGNAARATTDAAAGAGAAAARGGNNLLKWLVPLIVVAALVWFFTGRGRNSVQNAANTVSEGAAAATDAAGDAVAGAADAVTDAAGNAADAAGNAVAGATDAAGDAVSGAIEGLESAVVGDVNVGNQLTDLFGTATEALGGITDTESAEAALPQLNEVNESLGGLSDLVGQLPEAGKGAIGQIVSNGTEGINGIMEQLSAIPGVGGIIQGVVDSILEKLAALTA